MKSNVRPIDRGTRTVEGVTVTVTELVWPDRTRSFHAHRTDTGTDLTADGGFDAHPADDDLRQLLAEVANMWRCPGCTTAIGIGDRDLMADHVRDCLPGTVAPLARMQGPKR